MRIAQLAPPWISVPPPGYGGTERVVQQLCDGLTDLGHEVVLYATGDSHTKAELRSIFPVQMPELMNHTSRDARHVAFAFADIAADDFDIVHDHSGFLGVAFSRYIDVPIVHTCHGAFDQFSYPFYEQFCDEVAYVAISRKQESLAPPCMKFAGVAYNGMDVDAWPFRRDKGGYMLTFGRVSPAKGFHLSIEAAKRTGRRLIMSGVVQPHDRQYYDTQIAPHVDGDQIIYEDAPAEARRRELFAGADVFLFPITWPEPFGLVMIEALAAGTPVVALNEGSALEVVNHGTTGFVCDSMDEFIDAIGRVHEIDPLVCRRDVRQRFSLERMVHDYEAIYRKVLRRLRSLRALESA